VIPRDALNQTEICCKDSDTALTLRLHLEAISRLDDAETGTVKAFLDAFLLRAHANRWTLAG
jgi:hypothetical protein